MPVLKYWDATTSTWKVVGSPPHTHDADYVNEVDHTKAQHTALGLADAAHNHDADYAGAVHAHNVVVNTALEAESGLESIVLPWNSELVNWHRRGGTVTETYSGAFSGFGGEVTNLVRPELPGHETRYFTPDPAGNIYYDLTGTGFQSWADLSRRQPWVRVRAGQRPSRVLVQAAKPAGTWWTVHDDPAPTFSRGVWRGPVIPASAWPDSAPHMMVGLRFLFEFGTTEVCYLNSIGLAHPNIPLGWNAFLGDPAGWQAATYLNGWTTYGSPYSHARYRKDGSGVVHLDGLVKGGTVGSGYPIFALPAGYRPGYQQIYTVLSNGAIGRMDVHTTGNVSLVTGSNAWASLAGISFYAEP